MIPLAKPWTPDYGLLLTTLDSGWWTTGKMVAAIENKFANYFDVPTVGMTSSGTMALQLALDWLNLPKGSEVIVTAFSYVTTASCILKAKLKPVFVDIDSSLTIDPDLLEAAVTKNTRAVIITHFGGYPCDMKRILDTINKHKLFLIEDCAHALETIYEGHSAGTFGDFGCFSFHATKNMSCGEGGMFISHKLLTGPYSTTSITNNGMLMNSDETYDVDHPWYKCNMTDIAASLLLAQFDKITQRKSRREQIATYYREQLADFVTRNTDKPKWYDSVHGRHLFTLLAKDNREVVKKLRSCGIMASIHYCEALPDYTLFNDFSMCYVPVARKMAQTIFSIPCYPELTDSEVELVARMCKDALKA